MQKGLSAFRDLGAQVVAISPQKREHSAELKERHHLEFPVLEDTEQSWARRLSLTFAVPAELKEIYRGFGVDLAAYHGDDSWELPVPARLVVDGASKIRGIDADPDYTRRPEVEATLSILRDLTL